MSAYALVLGLPSRVRAMSLLHALPPPDVPALAGGAVRAAASRERFRIGVAYRVMDKDPGLSHPPAKVILRQTIPGLSSERSAVLPV